ncbi:MAG: hypothetical protein ACFB00_08790 [Parvularculaceae bacterium]
MASLRVNPKVRELLATRQAAPKPAPSTTSLERAADADGGASMRADGAKRFLLRRPGARPLAFEGRLLINVDRPGNSRAGLPRHGLSIYETSEGGFVAELSQRDADDESRPVAVWEAADADALAEALEGADPVAYCCVPRLERRADGSLLSPHALEAAFDAVRRDVARLIVLAVRARGPSASSVAF